jgi:hypothetical protein
VDGEKSSTRACCNPCGADEYCPPHRAAMRGPEAPSFDELVLALSPFF